MTFDDRLQIAKKSYEKKNILYGKYIIPYFMIDYVDDDITLS